MDAKDRIGDRNWDTYYERKKVGECECGRGYIEEVTLVASHEKVLRIERDYIGEELKCENPNCPSKKYYK